MQLARENPTQLRAALVQEARGSNLNMTEQDLLNDLAEHERLSKEKEKLGGTFGAIQTKIEKREAHSPLRKIPQGEIDKLSKETENFSDIQDFISSIDTRGKGIQFHGTSSEIKKFIPEFIIPVIKFFF